MERHVNHDMAGSLPLNNESKALRKQAPVTYGRLRQYKLLISTTCSSDVIEQSNLVHEAAEPAALM